eukprot:gb/GFBE01079951.1/.p1 GENE.gb/GFBE01079951.1/~~gb/GFBE01079951.1/.p1  ORF type:complete len:412 (+),score=82.09 gb/GFBE01079951.1/:1-1236(+)
MTFAAVVVALAWQLALPLAGASSSVSVDHATRTVLAADDECGDEDDACAVNALQLRGRQSVRDETRGVDAIQAHIDLASKQRKGMAIGACVDQPGKEVVCRYTGIRDKGSGEKANATDSFAIGSATKMFTAVAILQLAEQGNLSLSDPVEKFIPRATLDALTGGNGGGVKVSNLLGHTSGMGDYLNIPGKSDAEEIYELAKKHAQPAFTLQSLGVESYENVTKASYSNTGYIMLGDIIEKASGTSFEAFVTTNILSPAGMADSSFLTMKSASATGYAEGAWKGPIAMPPSLAWSAGDIVSTPRDMARFLRSAMKGQLFQKAETLKMWQNDAYYHPLEGMGIGYGYGLMHLEGPGMDLFGHAGQTFGFKSAALYDRATDVVYTWDQNDSQLGMPLADILMIKSIVDSQSKAQ